MATGIHYPVPIHLQPAAKFRARTATFLPERQADRIISLPHNQNGPNRRSPTFANRSMGSILPDLTYDRSTDILVSLRSAGYRR